MRWLQHPVLFAAAAAAAVVVAIYRVRVVEFRVDTNKRGESLAITMGF